MTKQIIHSFMLTVLFSVAAFIFCPADKISAETGNPPVITSEAYILLDAGTGQILYEKNMHQKHYPASLTKILTALLVFEQGGKLTDKIIMSEEAVLSIEPNSSHIALDVGEEITLEQALNAMAVASANDAANGIAEYLAGDLDSFGIMMTKKAAALGAKKSSFINAHGLPDENHYSTAYDLALIMIHAIKNPDLRQILSKRRYEMQPTNCQPEVRYLNNTNPLLNGKFAYEGIIAGKNGWTKDAQYTLATAAQKNGRELVVVALRNPDQEDICVDAIKLLDYGFNAFREVTVSSKLDADLLDSYPELDPEKVTVEGPDTYSFLLHNSLEKDDINISLSFLQAQAHRPARLLVAYTLPDNPFMYERIGEVRYTSAEKPVQDGEEGAASASWPRVLLNILFALITFVALCRLRVFIRKKRRRRRFLRRRVYRYRGY